MIESLVENIEPVAYSTLSRREKSRPGRIARHKVLDQMISIVAGSPNLEEQENMLQDRFKIIHQNFEAYSKKRFNRYMEMLPELQKFKNYNVELVKNRISTQPSKS